MQKKYLKPVLKSSEIFIPTKSERIAETKRSSLLGQKAGIEKLAGEIREGGRIEGAKKLLKRIKRQK